MNQQSLFPIDIVDPAEVEPEDKRIARQQAVEVHNTDYLRSFYTRKAAAILASSDETRIRLYNDWQRRDMALAGLREAA